MAINNAPSYFLDDSVVTTRGAEVTGASFANGMNAGGANAPGIGIGPGANAAGTVDQFTLLDQGGDGRTPQNSQAIGGVALGAGAADAGVDPVRFGTNAADGGGVMTDTGGATLTTLAAGWVPVVPI